MKQLELENQDIIRLADIRANAEQAVEMNKEKDAQLLENEEQPEEEE